MLLPYGLLFIVKERSCAQVNECLSEMFLAELVLLPEIVVVLLDLVRVVEFLFEFLLAQGRIHFYQFSLIVEGNSICAPVYRALFNLCE